MNSLWTHRGFCIWPTAYVRPKLEFGSVIWSPHQKTHDVEFVQKLFAIYLLESRKGVLSFTLAPYVGRCNVLRFQPLALRRLISDAMLARDIFVRNVNDLLISSEIRRTGVDRNCVV